MRILTGKVDHIVIGVTNIGIDNIPILRCQCNSPRFTYMSGPDFWKRYDSITEFAKAKPDSSFYEDNLTPAEKAELAKLKAKPKVKLDSSTTYELLATGGVWNIFRRVTSDQRTTYICVEVGETKDKFEKVSKRPSLQDACEFVIQSSSMRERQDAKLDIYANKLRPTELVYATSLLK